MVTAKAVQCPDDAALARQLGAVKKAWDALLSTLDRAEGLTRAWKFYGQKHGWQLKVLRGKRALLYLIVRDGRFMAAFPLKADALEAVRASDLPAAFIQEVEAGKDYPEGRPARVEVVDARTAALAKRLLAVVLAC
jgi:hypothetical protein